MHPDDLRLPKQDERLRLRTRLPLRRAMRLRIVRLRGS